MTVFFLPVDVRPAQREVLARTEAGGEGEGEENAVFCPERVIEESSRLVGVEDTHLALGGLGKCDAAGRISLDQPPTDCLLERGMKNGMGVLDGSRREAALRASRERRAGCRAARGSRVCAHRAQGEWNGRAKIGSREGLISQFRPGGQLEPAIEVLVQG